MDQTSGKHLHDFKLCKKPGFRADGLRNAQGSPSLVLIVKNDVQQRGGGGGGGVWMREATNDLSLSRFIKRRSVL